MRCPIVRAGRLDRGCIVWHAALLQRGRWQRRLRGVQPALATLDNGESPSACVNQHKCDMFHGICALPGVTVQHLLTINIEVLVDPPAAAPPQQTPASLHAYLPACSSRAPMRTKCSNRKVSWNRKRARAILQLPAKPHRTHCSLPALSIAPCTQNPYKPGKATFQLITMTAPAKFGNGTASISRAWMPRRPTSMRRRTCHCCPGHKLLGPARVQRASPQALTDARSRRCADGADTPYQTSRDGCVKIMGQTLRNSRSAQAQSTHGLAPRPQTACGMKVSRRFLRA